MECQKAYVPLLSQYLEQKWGQKSFATSVLDSAASHTWQLEKSGDRHQFLNSFMYPLYTHPLHVPSEISSSVDLESADVTFEQAF